MAQDHFSSPPPEKPSSVTVCPLRLNAAIVDTHRCAPVLTGAKHSYFTTGKSPLFVLFGFIDSIVHIMYN